MSKYTFLLIYGGLVGIFSLLSYFYILLSFLVIKMWFSFMEKYIVIGIFFFHY